MYKHLKCRMVLDKSRSKEESQYVYVLGINYLLLPNYDWTANKSNTIEKMSVVIAYEKHSKMIVLGLSILKLRTENRFFFRWIKIKLLVIHGLSTDVMKLLRNSNRQHFRSEDYKKKEDEQMK